MGCFARTCGISGTAIEEGDNVIVIVLNLPYKYIDLLTLSRGISEQSIRFNKPDEIYVGYNEKWMNAVLNGEIEGMSDQTLFDFKPFNSVVRGTYDDYGFINESEEPEEVPKQKEIYGNDSGISHPMFHEWAVEALFGSPIEDLTLDIKFAENILWKLYNLRRSPIDWMLGQQHPDIKEMKSIIEINLKTNQFLSERIARYEIYNQT